MNFDNLSAFWLFLLLIPIICLIIRSMLINRSFKNNKSYEFFSFNSKLPYTSFRIFVNILFLLVFSLVIIGLADPYVKILDSNIKYQNIRLFFLVDVSGSMIYAEDILPNRISAIKKELKEFYKSLDGEYEVSIIPFAGTPNPYYCPLTYKSNVILPLIDSLDNESAPAAGTDISAVVVSLRETILKEKLNKNGINLVILLSDGGREEFDANNKNSLFGSISKLTNNSKFYVVGVGGDKATPLIRRASNGGFVDYIKESDGKVSTSLIDEVGLKNIAQRGNGNYIRFDREGILAEFLNDAIRENRVPIQGELRYKAVGLRVYFFATAAFLLAAISFFLLKSR